MKKFLFLVALLFLVSCTATNRELEPAAGDVLAQLPTAISDTQASPTSVASPHIATPTLVPTSSPTTMSVSPTETQQSSATAEPTGDNPTPEPPQATPTLPLATSTLSPATPTATPQDEEIRTSTDTIATILPNAQTPTPNYNYFVSDRHGVTFQYPMTWYTAPTIQPRLEGSDGFVELLATNSQDNLLENACQDMNQATGNPIAWMTAGGQPACLIQAENPSADSTATLIVTFPEIREMIIPDTPYAFLIVRADARHMPDFMNTLVFTPALTPTPLPNDECDHDFFFDASRVATEFVGCPEHAPVVVTAVQQDFERGRLLWLPTHPLYPELGSVIVVLVGNGSTPQSGGVLYPDTWQVGEPEFDPDLVPPAGFVQPVRGFGKMWRDALQPALGWGVEEESSVTVQWQTDVNDRQQVLLLQTGDGQIALVRHESHMVEWYYLP